MISTNHPHQLSLGDNFVKVGIAAVIFFVSSSSSPLPIVSGRRRPHLLPHRLSSPPPSHLLLHLFVPGVSASYRVTTFLRFHLCFSDRRRLHLLPHRSSSPPPSLLSPPPPGVSASYRFHHFPPLPPLSFVRRRGASSFFLFGVECFCF